MKNQKVFNISMFYGVPSVKDTVGVSGCFSVIIFIGLHRHVTTDLLVYTWFYILMLIF